MHLKMIYFCLKCVYALVSSLSFQDTDQTSNGFFVSLVRDVKLQNFCLVILLETSQRFWLLHVLKC